MFAAYNYLVNISAKAQPGNVVMLIRLDGKNGQKYYRFIDMSVSSRIAVFIDSTDENGRVEIPGPFTSGAILFLTVYSAITGIPYNFFIYNVGVSYISHYSEQFRKSQESLMCGDNENFKKYSLAALLFNQERGHEFLFANRFLIPEVIEIPFSSKLCSPEHNYVPLRYLQIMHNRVKEFTTKNIDEAVRQGALYTKDYVRQYPTANISKCIDSKTENIIG